ncbi:uncharacterized protein FSUBG_12029 [Fusarium subglutinans]|uniref:Chitinase n=1 Tax=Gibberella subglutinans TaxID=42677 RepID=A0A8H5L846_GIBSU|nr:uncharacterized protein FSUBG_12029 [Fusarium subglutinans]KAF5586738.1 hypothetical protein FSUBG_12029 [Fusarium subglutinans]
MRLVGLVVALAALAEAQLPETPGANGDSTTTTLHPLPFETTSSEISAFDKTTSSNVALPETSTDVPVPDTAFTSTDMLPELSESKSTDIAVGGTSTANDESPLDSTSSGEIPVGQPTTGTGQPTGPETTAQQPPAIDTTTSQGLLVAETTTQQPLAPGTATTDQAPGVEPTSQQPPAPQSTTEQGPAVDTTTQQPPVQDSTTEQLAPQDTTSQPVVGVETTTTQAPMPVTTSSEQPVGEVPSTTEKPEDPKPTTTQQEEAEPTSKDEESGPKSEDLDNEDPKTKDETDPEPTTKKDEAPITVPPAAVTAEPQETISGVSDNTLHSTKDSDDNDVVVPVLFGPSCLIFCEHAGKDNGPGGIVLWGIGPAPGSYVLPPLPGITPAPSAVVINGGVPTPVGTQTPEDPDDQDDDDDDKSTAEEETKTEVQTTEAKSTAESSAASTTQASTTELPQLSMGVETVVVNVDATPTTGATSSEATTEATSTEASTQTTELPQLSMGVDTVVVDVDATPTTGGTTETSAATSTQTTELPQLSMGVDTVVVDVDATPTTGGTTETSAESVTTEGSSTEVSEATKTQDTTTAEMTSTKATTAESTTAGPTSTETSVQSTTFATSTTTKEPEREYPCIIHANPGIDPYCACETTVSGKGFYVYTDLISSSCADYTTFPSSIPTDAFEPKVTEKPDPEPFVKTDDGTVVSYPDRTVLVGNYPGGKYTYTQGVGDAVTLETPLPTQTDANNKGSSQCGSIDDACDRALNDGFDDETTYTDYVSRYARIKSGMIMLATFGQAGCTAQFKCDDYGLGMKGKDIKDAVQYMKDNDGVSKCGTALVGSWDQEHGRLGEGEPLRSNPSNAFFKSLFQLCSPTLESLTWESWNPEAWKPLSLGTDPKSFPKLRQLRIKPGRDAIDEASFASLLSAPLKSLEPSHSSFRLFEHQIRSRIEEPYRDLEELVIELTENPQLATELILKHNSLKKLWVAQNYYMSGRDNSLDRVLIPGLGKGRFNNLRSLYVQFGGQNKDAGYDKDHFFILPESLATICELTTLEQLGLRCDEMGYESYSPEDYTGVTFPIWLIDHGKLRAHLQSLKNLKMLVIRGDTYPSRAGEGSSHTGYYRQAYANPEDLQTAEDHPELGPFVQERGESRVAWQHAHLYRMVEHARSYRAVLPKLEWILCGKRPMRFIEDAQGVVQPHPVGNEMDECKTFIGRVFGLASEVEIAHSTD